MKKTDNLQTASYLGISGVYGAGVDFTDKIGGARQYVKYMFNRTNGMFEYSGLPDTMQAREVELYLQQFGYMGVTKVKGDLYCFWGGLGGEPDPYYKPTILTVTNPALNFNANLRIGEDCVVIPNDTLYMGLLPMYKRYASMLAENDATIRIADINARLINLISATDDRTLESAKQYLRDIETGKLGVVSETAFIEGLKTLPYSGSGSTNNVTQLIELQQYLKASWFNDLGLNANYNMKREAINSQEAQMGSDSLLPLAEDMLRQRQKGFDAVNAMYGTNIQVKFAGSWEVREEAQDLALEMETNSEPKEEAKAEEVNEDVKAE